MAEWIQKVNGPPIILLLISSARAEREAMFYVEMSKHAHIVRTYGLVSNPENEVMLVQERAQHGNLMQFLKNRNQPVSETVLKEIFIQITHGMSFLAHNNIVHGDLACRNILVFNYDERNPMQTLVKVTDFGLSRGSSIYQSTSTSKSSLNVTPYRYAAPEILRNPSAKEVYSEKSDMYSMSVLMWEAYFSGRKRPWSHINDDDEVKRRVLGEERLQQPPTCSEKMWSLIKSMMLPQPFNRPTFAALHRQLIELDIGNQTQKLLSNVEKALRAIKSNSETISLHKTALCDDEMKIIAEELKRNTTVRELVLDINNLSDEGAIALAEMLEVNETINTVSLRQNNVSSKGAKRLARALLTNKTLISLRIDANPLCDDGIQAICEALKTNKTLTSLCVHESRISIIGIELIAEMLRTTTTLKAISMGDNDITDKGPELIGEALKINSSITWLYMASSDVTDKGAFALADAVIVHRRTLNYFYLVPDPQMTDAGRLAIKNALRVNAEYNR